jgi:carboxylesterase
MLLRGHSFSEAMRAASLDPKAPNDVRDRGGWGGIAGSQVLIRGRSDPSPFDLKSANASDVGVLLIHGFTASPSEMRPMAEFIHLRTGWRCKAILLPGHGTRVQDMENSPGETWVAAVDAAYAELAESCRHIFLAGVSLGGVLCCQVGLKRLGDPRLRGLILMAPAFGVSRRRTVAVRVLRSVRPMRSKGPKAAHYFLEKRLFSYVETPLNRAADVIRLGRHAWKNLDKLRDVPVLMFAGALDTTVSLSLIREAARRNPAIRFVSLPKSRHILTVEPDAAEAFAASVEFMEANCTGGVSRCE